MANQLFWDDTKYYPKIGTDGILWKLVQMQHTELYMKRCSGVYLYIFYKCFIFCFNVYAYNNTIAKINFSGV